MQNLIQPLAKPIRSISALSSVFLCFLLTVPAAYSQPSTPKLIVLSPDTFTAISNHDASLTALMYYDWKQYKAKCDSLQSENKILHTIIKKQELVIAEQDTMSKQCFVSLYDTNSKWSAERSKRQQAERANRRSDKYLIVSISLNSILLAVLLFGH